MRGARRSARSEETPQIRRTLRDFGWTPPGEAGAPRPGSPSPGPGRHRTRRHRGRRIAVLVAVTLAIAVPAAGGYGWHWVHQHPDGVVGTALGVNDGRGAPDRASRGGARTTPSGSPSGSRSASASASASPSKRASASATPRHSGGGSASHSTGSGSSAESTGTSLASRYEQQVLTEINAARSSAGCGALRYDARLAKAARGHSADMAAHNYFDHTAPNGSTPWDRAKAAGYDQPSAENIAAGQRTPHDAVQAWLHSSGHRANIMNCDSHATGIGFARGGSYGYYWTELFGYV
ncbi:hypothetical protein Athai_55680 [Actinocatenispora thailandica]|uniref:SCP domain-containing protein n=1 Tax=Actinocatenispora thailandica TaxID=227318 RepID=A0A7R7DUJ0_9ACTN|nr:CAP domain-containing protein [Actinocatenispora thailandica]BCJ38065.1 hypothetical protein Athai_55680 [Actinocatenispora thailandica]